MTPDHPLNQAQEVLDTYAEDLKALGALNFLRACYDDPPLEIDDVVFVDGPYPGTRAIHLKGCECHPVAPKEPEAKHTVKLTKRFVIKALWGELKDMFRR